MGTNQNWTLFGEDEEFESMRQEIPLNWGDTYFHYMQTRTKWKRNNHMISMRFISRDDFNRSLFYQVLSSDRVICSAMCMSLKFPK